MTKKEKIISSIVIAFFALLLFGGIGILLYANSKKSEVHAGNGYFKTVVFDSHCCIVYDPNTMVMYTISTGSYNWGTATLLVNPDGTPLLYDGTQYNY